MDDKPLSRLDLFMGAEKPWSTGRFDISALNEALRQEVRINSQKADRIQLNGHNPFEDLDIPAIARRCVSRTGFSANPDTNRCDRCHRIIKKGDWPFCPHG